MKQSNVYRYCAAELLVIISHHLRLPTPIPLQARLRSPSHQALLGYSGSWSTHDPATLSNTFFKLLLGNTWEAHTSASGKAEYKAVASAADGVAAASGPIYMLPSDLALVHDPELLAIAEDFVSDNAAFLREFSAAWTKLMNADRFDAKC